MSTLMCQHHAETEVGTAVDRDLGVRWYLVFGHGSALEQDSVRYSIVGLCLLWVTGYHQR